MLKIKRYHGKKSNVDTNIYFEEYMNTVAKGMDLVDKIAKVNILMGHSEKKNILAYKPAGFLSRSRATREFGLTKEVIDMLGLNSTITRSHFERYLNQNWTDFV